MHVVIVELERVLSSVQPGHLIDECHGVSALTRVFKV